MELPNGLPFAVRSASIPLLKSARDAGWQFDYIQLANGRVSFGALSVVGRRVVVECDEGDLPARLASLLDNPIFAG